MESGVKPYLGMKLFPMIKKGKFVRCNPREYSNGVAGSKVYRFAKVAKFSAKIIFFEIRILCTGYLIP